MKPRLPESDSHADELVDAHLRTALRHAPDADAAPPAALSAAILSQARAAASIKQTSTQAEPWAPVWQLLAWLRQGWIALSQPALAAGVASVMVASVVGVMWWDRVPEDVSAPRELSRERSTSSAQPNQKAEAAESATNEAVAAPASSIPAANAPGVVADANKPAVTKAPPATANQQAPTRVASKAPEQRRNVADAAQNDNEVALKAPTHRPEAPPATAPVALPESTGPRTRADAPAPAPALAAAPTPALKASPLERESARASGIALGFAANTPVASLREALRDEPERWAWQKNAGTVAPVVPELPSWLGQIESATSGRWAPQLDLRATDAAQKTLLTLRWTRDGQTAYTLVLRIDGLLWQQTGASAWFAPMDVVTVKRLMDTVP
ncbi:MAG: hypothetical protein RIS44_3023 [Pseudomonadota bacterium]|jgi:hypothetical protein